MDLRAAGLNEQPFPSHGKPPAVVTYRAQNKALQVLRETLDHPTGLSLLQGPALSGKSILIRNFMDSIGEDHGVAVVDGKGMNTTRLLAAALHQFGFDVDLSSNTELMGLLRVYAMQQAGSGHPPVLIVENTHELNRSALRALCELAEVRVRFGSALKIVLMSDRALAGIINSAAMQAIRERVLHDFHLRPMTCEETRDYVHAKLNAAGAEFPAFVFPKMVCDELWRASGGWPGIVDRIALLAIARAESLPISSENVERPTVPAGTWIEVADPVEPAKDGPTPPAQLVVSTNGRIVKQTVLDSSRLLVGRSEHNDIAINSPFISRHHALLVRHGSSTFLMDLNSTNGTFVNSRRASNQVLRNDDVISIGHHTIKFIDPYATTRTQPEGDEFADTAIMKTLEDVRSLLARENTALLPEESEDLPTLQH